MDVNKSVSPLENTVLVPLNEGTDYRPHGSIIFRIGASDLNMWIISESYISFDVLIPSINDQVASFGPYFIKNAANVFSNVIVRFGGVEIYNEAYNVEIQTLNMLSLGDSYLKSHYNTFTTIDMIKEKIAHLRTNEPTQTDGKYKTSANTIRCLVPVNQLFPIFKDINSEGLPVRSLKSQIEFELRIAEPYRYLLGYNETINDFTSDDKIKTLYPSVSINMVRLNCYYWIPTGEEAEFIDQKATKDGSYTFRYNRWNIGIRQVSGISFTNSIPFAITSENIKDFLVYCHKSTSSPSLMYRPNVNNVQLVFGSNRVPTKPIPFSSDIYPHLYKFTTDDVLEYVDSYYGDVNGDYIKSYRVKDESSVSSSYVILGGCYVSDVDKLGISSSSWNSQYQLDFNASPTTDEESLALTFVLAIRSEYGLIITDRQLKTIEI